jgi:RNA polymerase sigma-70 factor (ECF subfamily)
MNIDVAHYYRTYGPMVLRRCRQLLRDEHCAQDAMQEVFVQVMRRGSTLTMEYPSSLLYRIATNISLNLLRSQKRRQEVQSSENLVDCIAGDDTFPQQDEAASILDVIFRREKASTRTMAVYHFVDGLTLEETAREMNMSVSGVRKRLRLFKEKLAAMRPLA